MRRFNFIGASLTQDVLILARLAISSCTPRYYTNASHLSTPVFHLGNGPSEMVELRQLGASLSTVNLKNALPAALDPNALIHLNITMSSPISTTTTTAIATALLALTTPFIQPLKCESHFSLTLIPTTTRTITVRYTTLYEKTSYPPCLVSTPVASCYPPSWEAVVPESRFHFSPAVCPSNWTYYNIAISGTVSTACCCNR
jgi:hypothetical protein